MGATAHGNTQSTKDYEVPEPATYPGRCIGVIELGTIDSEYQGKAKKKTEIMLLFELSELMEDGRPFVVNWKGTNSTCRTATAT